MNRQKWHIKPVCMVMGVAFLLVSALPGNLFAADETAMLRQRLEQMAQEMAAMQKKLQQLEEKSAAKEEVMEEIDDRLNKAELHTATDKVSFGVELRSRADTLHYQDVQVAPMPWSVRSSPTTMPPTRLPADSTTRPWPRCRPFWATWPQAT